MGGANIFNNESRKVSPFDKEKRGEKKEEVPMAICLLEKAGDLKGNIRESGR